MKKSRKISITMLVLLLVISIPMAGFAGNGNGNGKGNDKVLDKSWKENKNQLELQKDTLEEQKEQLETDIEAIEEQCEAAEESGDAELAEQLRLQLQEKQTEKNALKIEMKNIRMEMKSVIRNRYTNEELENLEQVAEEIEGLDEEITAIPVENIIAKNKDIKFDTPPVIKRGRTLIPVRAITEGFGAELEWKSEEQKVIITKGDTEIVLHIDSNVAIVNGEEVMLDVSSKNYSNRTYVPLRFILETFKLNIDWDEETGIIEIEEDGDTDTTTDGAIDGDVDTTVN